MVLCKVEGQERSFEWPYLELVSPFFSPWGGSLAYWSNAWRAAIFSPPDLCQDKG